MVPCFLLVAWACSRRVTGDLIHGMMLCVNHSFSCVALSFNVCVCYKLPPRSRASGVALDALKTSFIHCTHRSPQMCMGAEEK